MIDIALIYLLYIEEKCLDLVSCIIRGNVAISLHLNEENISTYCTEPLRVKMIFLSHMKPVELCSEYSQRKPTRIPT